MPKPTAQHKRKPVPPRRRPGRPNSTAGVDQRARLLDATVALFGERGIGATTLREIARRAAVTPALLHYYFESKEALVQTLLTERIAPFVAVSVAPLLAPLASHATWSSRLGSRGNSRVRTSAGFRPGRLRPSSA